MNWVNNGLKLALALVGQLMIAETDTAIA